MKCGRCGTDMKKEWQFCPECGAPSAMDFNDLFNNVFNKLLKQVNENPELMERLEAMSKQLEKKMGQVNINPALGGKPGVKRSGFTINIKTRTGEQPKVDIKTFGNVKKTEVQKKFHVHPGKSGKIRHGFLKKRPEETTEPKSVARRVQRGVEVEIDLPGVKPQDIEINDLHNSIEIKAGSGKKGFFKIIKKPQNTMVRGHKFSKGKLKLLIG